MYVTVEEQTTASDLSTSEVIEPGSLEQTNTSEGERQLSQQNIVIDASQQSVSEEQISRAHLPHTSSTTAGTSTSELPAASETDVVKDNRRKTTSCTKRKYKRQKVKTMKQRKRGSGQAKHESDDDSEKCVVCHGADVGGEDWINCDFCKLWFHRKCTEISDEEWHLYTLDEDSSPFVCPLCQ
jgi:hypothetical protein